MEPLGYIDFLSVTMNARLVLTDSDGLQEETTILDVPCVTLRENTERPITITEEGTNRLDGTRREGILASAKGALATGLNGKRIPDKWDGKAATRIAALINSATASAHSAANVTAGRPSPAAEG